MMTQELVVLCAFAILILAMLKPAYCSDGLLPLGVGSIGDGSGSGRHRSNLNTVWGVCHTKAMIRST